MILLVLVFALGILLGFIFKDLKGLEKASGKLSHIAVLSLLFLLGLSVGINKEVRSHLDSLGLTALLITVFALFGSLLLSWLTWILFYKQDEK